MRMHHVAAIILLLTGFTVAAMTGVPALSAQQAPPGQTPPNQSPAVRGGGGGGLAAKAPHLVASAWTASSAVARTKLRHEWVDIPLGDRRLRTWVEYPAAEGRAPVVLVLQHEPGLDDWMRSVADQLASEGFIAVAPDLFSGFGPGGGNFDSFPAPDVAMRQAGRRLTTNEAMRRALVAAEFGLKLPRASSAIGVLGVGSGGALAFRFAAEAPAVHATVVFYGAAPDESVLRRVKAPVIGFFGDDDEAVTATVDAAEETMKRIGKPFEVHRYEGATHAFLTIQFEGRNTPAVEQAWPRATAFLKDQLLREAR